ncbi:MAG: YraN family protein [Lachnospiraceae bacterium]|nr:YraN family protein [Lachnospiraceae bacterium]
MNRRKVGGKYEDEAVSYLEENGYRILERNYRDHRFGELDAIGQKDGAIVFFEIKYRSGSACGSPLEAVDKRKRRKISRTALHYLTSKGYGLYSPCRFDVIGISGDRQIKHITNAFEYCGTM